MKKILFLLVTLVTTLQAGYSFNDVKIAKKNISETLPKLRGLCSLEKSLAIFDLVLEVQPKVYVEIGIFSGASLFPAALALKLIGEGTLLGIDPWDHEESVKYFDPITDIKRIKDWKKYNIDTLYGTYIQCLKDYELEVYVQTIKKPSFEAIKEIDFIDILHIDGNFGGDMPLRDVQLYLPKVKSGGYIWLNDAIYQQSAREALLQSCDFVKAVDLNCLTSMLFRKR
jgi:hypothetical protein